MVCTYVHLGWRQQGIQTKFSRVTLWERPLGRQRKWLEDIIKLHSKQRHCDYRRYYWWMCLRVLFNCGLQWSSEFMLCYYGVDYLLQRDWVSQLGLPEMQWGAMPQAGRRLPPGSSARYLWLLSSWVMWTRWGREVFQRFSDSRSASRDQEVRNVWSQSSLSPATRPHLQGKWFPCKNI